MLYVALQDTWEAFMDTPVLKANSLRGKLVAANIDFSVACS